MASTILHSNSWRELQCFIHQITNQGPMIIVARDTGGHIFGGFASVSWSIKSHFVGKYAQSSLKLTQF